MPDIKLPDFENIIDEDKKNDNDNNFNFPYEININKEFEKESMIKFFRDNKFDYLE